MRHNKYLAILFTITLILPLSTFAAEKPKRWFEMEVILFSQLGDKAQLEETFLESNVLPKYRKVRDLLSPYLSPDISLLKKSLPICGVDDKDTTNTITLPNIFELKTLLTLEAELLANSPELTSAYYNIPDNSLNNTIDHNSAISTADKSLSTNFNNDINTASTDSAELEVISPEEQKAILTLVEAANAKFSPPIYQYQANTFSKELCQLSPKTLANLKADIPDFDENKITITNVPRTINGVENIGSDKPYLINQDSLQLHDIVKQLKRSKDFRPLLHIGWRQSEPAINKKRSIPMRLYAGENLQANYLKQLENYQAEQAKAAEQEQRLQQIIMNNNAVAQSIEPNMPTLLSIESTEALTKKQALANIIASLDEVPEDKTLLFNQLNMLSENTSEPTLQAPQPPTQPWSIDGLFNVHLNHYLYITADFNIATMSLTEQASKSLAKGVPQAIKSVQFSQNRRVISKEIHYFDHPYMGMIVQIRRYKKPLPEVELIDHTVKNN